MKTEHALRYLLLRHLKAFEGRVPRQRFLEVTRSLQVAVARDRFLVSWRLDGQSHQEEFPRRAFVFYRRGDVDAASRDEQEDLHNDNDSLARAFAERVFGTRAGHPPTHARLEPQSTAGMVESTSFAVFVGVAGSLGITATAALLAVCIAEFARRGRLLASILLLPVSAVGPPFAAAFAALAYGTLQFLDPFPSTRAVRLIACALAVVIGLARCEMAQLVAVDLSTVVLALLAVVTAAARSLVSTHFRVMPLALPFYCLGLALDGYSAAAWGGLAISILFTCFSAYGHQWLPVQEERSLTPNG